MLIGKSVKANFTYSFYTMLRQDIAIKINGLIKNQIVGDIFDTMTNIIYGNR